MTHIWNNSWDQSFKKLAQRYYSQNDASHDLLHVLRVVRLCLYLAQQENACLDITMPAAWLHDVVAADKSSLEHSKKASKESAKAASVLLTEINYPDEGRFAQIGHAIEAHSFSANIIPETNEAKIVQDADRLDALGVIGLFRMAIIGGRLGTPHLYCEDDLFASHREPDDRTYLIDHIWKKLNLLPDRLNTASVKKIAQVRIENMQSMIKALQGEIVVLDVM